MHETFHDDDDDDGDGGGDDEGVHEMTAMSCVLGVG